MRTNNDKQHLYIDKEAYKDLNEFFDALEQREVKAAEKMDALIREVKEKQARDFHAAESRYLLEEAELRLMGIKNIHEYQKKFLEDYNEKEYKRKLDLVNKVYKEEVEKLMPSLQKKAGQQAIQNKEENEAWIKLYEKLEAEGTTLTPEQQEDKRRREEQLDLARKTLIEVTKQTALNKALSGAMNQTLNAVNTGINTYVKYQGGINARLQGASLGGSPLTGGGIVERLIYGTNTFGILENRLKLAAGMQPYVKTETMLSNLDALVKAGIASNVEQRAFLQTVKENIADTFNASDAALLRIIRLQQQDSTAARLGMEAYLTKFLNQMVENTEYLNQTFNTVEESLVEASSQMTVQASTEFEYIVQKWLGALSGTGLSETTAQNIAQALGYLGSGDVSGFGGSSVQGLLTMAASRSGLNIGEILNRGLDASTANVLLNALANYMVEIGSNSNNVVRSQLAQTFGLNISDITAAQQLSKDFDSIYNNMLSFTGMYTSLNAQMMELPTRLSVAQMLQTSLDNSLFSLASGIAENPALAAIWKITDMIQTTTGGINIPGTMFLDLNATVEQLMKLGIVGISSLGMIGEALSGATSQILPSSMLWKLGILSGNTAINRGSGLTSLLHGFTESGSTYVGQGSGSSIYQQTLQQAAESATENSINPETGDTEALPNIWDYLNTRFDPKFDALIDAVNELRSKVVDGEIEIVDSNRNAFIV